MVYMGHESSNSLRNCITRRAGFVFFLQWLKPSYRHELFKKTLYCLNRSITSVQCTKHEATYETSQLSSRNLSKSIVVGGLHFTQFVRLWEKWGWGGVLI